ncbi:MAG: Rieske 2Fe-2S domain-containing protein [Verrucomicrobia bacterium]|nr:Rieske 2Fe-2S domain-containing protein [Verrucomicrobiota bacterium]
MSNISRRKFIGGAAVAGAGACVCGLSGCATFTKTGNTSAILGGAYTVENNKVKITLDKVAELGNIGGSVKIVDARLPQPIIIARIADADYAVMSIKCPHRGAEVEYKHDAKTFRCASLGHSTFATDGKLLKGLASRSLTKFEAKLDPTDKNSLVIAL